MAARSMKKIIGYRAVSAIDADILTDEVNGLIREGFQPFGPIATSIDKDNIYYTQAMVRHAEKKRAHGLLKSSRRQKALAT